MVRLAASNNYRSKFEKSIAKNLGERKVPFEYETVRIKYTVPSRQSTYTPDFTIGSGNTRIIIESKGRFRSAEERQKMVLVKQQNPHLDIRFIFQNENVPIYKGSKTTVAEWARKNGFPYAEKVIPNEWIDESQEK